MREVKWPCGARRVSEPSLVRRVRAVCRQLVMSWRASRGGHLRTCFRKRLGLRGSTLPTWCTKGSGGVSGGIWIRCSGSSAIPPRSSGGSGYTSTPVPIFTGKTSWDQYRQVFEAIVSSNGWDGVTASLQLVSHLGGDALNVALLVPASRRLVPGVLLDTLTEHYSSPGRLAGYRRRFERISRKPGEDLFVFEDRLLWRSHHSVFDW